MKLTAILLAGVATSTFANYALAQDNSAGGGVETITVTGDDSVGVPVLVELYDRMKDTPVSINLPSLWKRLGVSATGEGIAFAPDADLSAIRAGITAKPNQETVRIRVPAFPETPLRVAPGPASGPYSAACRDRI